MRLRTLPALAVVGLTALAGLAGPVAPALAASSSAHSAAHVPSWSRLSAQATLSADGRKVAVLAAQTRQSRQVDARDRDALTGALTRDAAAIAAAQSSAASAATSTALADTVAGGTNAVHVATLQSKIVTRAATVRDQVTQARATARTLRFPLAYARITGADVTPVVEPLTDATALLTKAGRQVDVAVTSMTTLTPQSTVQTVVARYACAQSRLAAAHQSVVQATADLEAAQNALGALGATRRTWINDTVEAFNPAQ